MADSEPPKQPDQPVTVVPPKGKVEIETKVKIELDEEKLTCLNGPGLTTTIVVVT